MQVSLTLSTLVVTGGTVVYVMFPDPGYESGYPIMGFYRGICLCTTVSGILQPVVELFFYRHGALSFFFTN